jgi:hypothetical protein
MDAKTRLLDNNVRPGPFDKLSVAYDLSCTFEERNQDVESTAAQGHWLAVVHQEPLRGD